MRHAEALPTAMLVAVSALMAAAFVGGVHGQQHDPTKPCLNGCAKGQKPPGCCEEPDCSIFQEYATQEALTYMLSPESLPPSWIPAVGISGLSLDAYAQALYGKARHDIDQELQKSASCPGYSPPRSHLEVNADCQIGTSKGQTFTPMSREDARTDLNLGDCPEIRDAEYDAAERRQTECEAAKNHPSIFRLASRNDIADAAREQAEERLYSLKKAMMQFWASCLNLANAETLQKIADALAPPLKLDMPSKPPPKKPKRSASGGGRGRRGL